ncbi:hypothetical protein [Planomicrobium sp. CPCC 101110]|uniref:hypothetical protein n=1 Tax=Planomicrobium sp. CPCC 101110 TaxID=2599619 RepID=UPI0011B4EEA8|nr:hypothetical protein [Planomicrobium sp. CPCC 101110]TWT25758.1 hypothetical protein FQV30_08105 [Planomicrobium sp. CPCC 101110]
MRATTDLTIDNHQDDRISKPRGLFAISISVSLHLLVGTTLIHAAVQGNSNDVATCLKILFLFNLPLLIENFLKFKLSALLFVTIQLFIFASMLLGEINAFYIKFPYWDTMLHTVNGFLFAALGYILLKLISEQNHSGRQAAKSIYFIITAFCFSMTVGVLWEFYEITMDTFFGRDMQKDTIIQTINSMKINESTQAMTVFNNINDVSVNGQNLALDGYLDIGLYDTMSDLFVNLVGASFFCLLSYLEYQLSPKFKIFSNLINCSKIK